MAFDRKLYSECKKLAMWNLEHQPFQYTGTLKEWVLSTLSTAGEYIRKQQYEQAKAIKDAVIECTNKHLPEKDRIDINTVIKEKYLFKTK